jgi:hypothetical protein
VQRNLSADVDDDDSSEAPIEWPGWGSIGLKVLEQHALRRLLAESVSTTNFHIAANRFWDRESN